MVKATACDRCDEGSREIVDTVAHLEKDLADMARRVRRAGYCEASHFIRVAAESIAEASNPGKASRPN